MIGPRSRLEETLVIGDSVKYSLDEAYSAKSRKVSSARSRLLIESSVITSDRARRSPFY